MTTAHNIDLPTLAETAQGTDRSDLLWTSARGGYLGPPAGNKSWLSGAVSRCQKTDPSFPRVTAHDLRHTAASLAISSGANPKVVQRMLGHASAAMTLDVDADLFESDLDDVAVTVSKMCPRWATSPPSVRHLKCCYQWIYGSDSGALGEIRTHTVRVLNPFPLPVGIRGQAAQRRFSTIEDARRVLLGRCGRAPRSRRLAPATRQ